MADIINLQKARKQKNRLEKEVRAESNRLKFGRTKAEKQKSEAVQQKSENHLDGHKRTP